MYGILDLTWVPTEDEPTPPVGKGDAIVRDDDYEYDITFVNPDGTPHNPLGTFVAQLRTSKVTSATDPGAPLADFDVVVVANVLTLNLPRAETVALPDTWVWDLERTLDGKQKTIFSGVGRTVGDVTR